MAGMGWLTVLILSFVVLLSYASKEVLSVDSNQVTIRMNTFRRNDLLKQSVSHYITCSCVKEIQIVWSDQTNKPPTDLLTGVASYKEKIKYELHDRDSLNNRFLPTLQIPTLAVLSLDDDLLIPCADLEFAIGVWSSNNRTLVGYSPRMHVRDIWTGALRYLRWQHTWWSGAYSIVLTKAAFFHRDYLLAFRETVPEALMQYVDKHRNCEDIFMAYVIALKSGAPPVWIRGRVREIGQSGISSGADHFEIRSACLSVLEDSMSAPSPWVTGYQKAIKFGFVSGWDMGLFDFLRLFYDTK